LASTWDDAGNRTDGVTLTGSLAHKMRNNIGFPNQNSYGASPFVRACSERRRPTSGPERRQLAAQDPNARTARDKPEIGAIHSVQLDIIELHLEGTEIVSREVELQSSHAVSHLLQVTPSAAAGDQVEGFRSST